MKYSNKSISSHVANQIFKELSNQNIKFNARIEGNSMWPILKQEDTIVMIPIKPPIKIGEIVAYYSDHHSKFIAHRVIQVKGDYILTRGDNCPQADPAISYKLLAAKVDRIIRKGKYIKLGLGKDGVLLAYFSRFYLLTLAKRFFQKINKFLR